MTLAMVGDFTIWFDEPDTPAPTDEILRRPERLFVWTCVLLKRGSPSASSTAGVTGSANAGCSIGRVVTPTSHTSRVLSRRCARAKKSSTPFSSVAAAADTWRNPQSVS
jgi:hypothetical protein